MHPIEKGPWVVMRDLNMVMNTEERIGSNVRISEIQPGRQFMEKFELSDIPYGGRFYTWSNKQEARNRAYSKANTLFLLESISDHSPTILRVDNSTGGGYKPFKHFIMWSSASDYKDRIAAAWAWDGIGTSMYCLTKKLKQVMRSLIELNKGGFCELSPHNPELIAVEKEANQEYIRKHKMYMQFLRQKANCNWIKEGDENTTLSHRSI
ncbi:Cysteine--tRNA ligase [Bienertia sinuspersici]